VATTSQPASSDVRRGSLLSDGLEGWGGGGGTRDELTGLYARGGGTTNRASPSGAKTARFASPPTDESTAAPLPGACVCVCVCVWLSCRAQRERERTEWCCLLARTIFCRAKPYVTIRNLFIDVCWLCSLPSGLMGSSCAAGLDRFRRSLGRHLPGAKPRFRPKTALLVHPKPALAEPKASTTQKLPNSRGCDGFPARRRPAAAAPARQRHTRK
jgi:hypothetical protein